MRAAFGILGRAIVAASVGAAVMLAYTATAQGKQATGCEGQPGKRTASVPKDAPAVRLDRGTKVMDFAFAADRTPKTRTRSITATPALTDAELINVEVEEDLVTPEDHTISPSEISVTKAVVGSGNLQICLLVDPAKVEGLHAGRYVGDIVISAPGGDAISVPVQATFRSSTSDAWTAAASGAVFGLLLKVLGELAAGKRKKATWAAFKGYVAHWSFWSALAATPLLVIAGYVTLYVSNDTWGAGHNDGWKLFLTCLGYQLGGVGLVEIIRQATGSAPPTDEARVETASRKRAAVGTPTRGNA